MPAAPLTPAGKAGAALPSGRISKVAAAIQSAVAEDSTRPKTESRATST